MASRLGLGAAMICAVVTSIFIVLRLTAGISATEETLWRLVEASLFGIIALGIYQMSRIAAISGLILYILERVVLWMTMGSKNPVLAIVFTLAFVNGVRGTLGYYRFKKSLRKIPYGEAKREIAEFFSEHENEEFTYEELQDSLNLDMKTIRSVCKELIGEGKIGRRCIDT